MLQLRVVEVTNHGYPFPAQFFPHNLLIELSALPSNFGTLTVTNNYLVFC